MTNEKKHTLDETTEEFNNAETVELTEESAIDEAAETMKSKTETVEESNSVNDYLQEIQALNHKLEEAENRYLRLHADFENFRRRTRLDQESNEKYRAQKLIAELLPVLDNFERALNIEAENEQTKSLLQGMDMVFRSFFDALKKEGVEAIETVGKEFDPHQHHAVMQGEDTNYGPNIVIEEFQKGYVLKDRVIRPAMVKVNQ
ncbi:nucleotide exchange factor GrpE [Bacillus sp. BRMEA1]|uniref:nucleotide exchange factor GrpE n=1 Tax=Neobacillus endophyticus TaxID=2738405 RepID=UPI001567B1D1|nr:nucleotide exchange factor GrpE [Neobacillus endophyticus]NRD75891.1 nucleotide exchange factor GrpE [Neobacillus endophyticus]